MGPIVRLTASRKADVAASDAHMPAPTDSFCAARRNGGSKRWGGTGSKKTVEGGQPCRRPGQAKKEGTGGATRVQTVSTPTTRHRGTRGQWNKRRPPRPPPITPAAVTATHSQPKPLPTADTAAATPAGVPRPAQPPMARTPAPHPPPPLPPYQKKKKPSPPLPNAYHTHATAAANTNVQLTPNTMPAAHPATAPLKMSLRPSRREHSVSSTVAKMPPMAA